MIAYPKAIHDAWLPICAVKELGKKPIRRRLHGLPLVIFEARDGPAVLVDRCPHRNVALSKGHVDQGAIVCPYHGWTFERDGTCSKVPGAEPTDRLCAKAFPVRVENGLVFTNTSDTPRDFIPLPYPINDPGFDHWVWPSTYRGGLVDGMENLLDPAHPHTMHPRIVGRNPVRVKVDVVREQTSDTVTCTYHEGTRKRGMLAALLEGERSQGLGRFTGPTTCQIGFIGKNGPRLFTSAILSPQSNDEVQAFAIFSTPKGRLPAWLKGRALEAFHRPIIKEDQDMMAMQLDNLQAFGGPKYTAGPMDYIKPAMVQLMQGKTLPDQEDHFTCWL